MLNSRYFIGMFQCFGKCYNCLIIFVSGILDSTKVT